MPTYPVTGSDGKLYDVDANSPEEAVKGWHAWRQQQISENYQKEGDALPEWAKPFRAMKDVGVMGLNTMTAGLADKAYEKYTGDPEERMKTQAIKDSMGWAGTALDAGLFARAIPSAVPKLVKWAGGGPAARTVVGTTAAAGEGAGYGAVDASTHDQDVGTGTMWGAGGSAIGHQIGNVLNKGYKWARGIDDVPPVTVKVLPKGRDPTKAEVVEAKFHQAKEQAKLSDDPLAEQRAVRGVASKLATTVAPGKNRPMMSPGEIALLNKIAAGDPATNATRKIGSYLDNKIIGATAGIGANQAAGPLAGILTTGAFSGAANIFKHISAGGTEEALQNLRRTMTRTKKYVPPITPAEQTKLRLMGMKGLLDYSGVEDLGYDP